MGSRISRLQHGVDATVRSTSFKFEENVGPSGDACKLRLITQQIASATSERTSKILPSPLREGGSWPNECRQKKSLALLVVLVRSKILERPQRVLASETAFQTLKPERLSSAHSGFVLP